MADAPAPDGSGEAGTGQYGHGGPDRRKTIDLLRVERGEPERRKLPRFEIPRQVPKAPPPQDSAG